MTESELPTDGVSLAGLAMSMGKASIRPGTLCVVSLPLGDLEDISIRALRTLNSVSVVAAENPARTRALLRTYGITTPVVGYRDRGDVRPSIELIASLQAGATAALVCDAGTPLIADAGGHLVRAALDAGVAVTAAPGPTAALAALVLAGAAEGGFVFDGFPPRARYQRESYFLGLAAEKRTLLIYETRRYLADTLRRLRDSLGSERQIFIAHDLTKKGETRYYSGLEDAAQRFRDPAVGEYVLVISRLRQKEIPYLCSPQS